MSSDDTPTTAERSSDCRLRGVGVGVKDKTIRSQARGEDYPPGFSEFWETYPRRQAKANAYKAWKRIKPDRQLLDLMKAAIARQKRSEAWQRENGQFIPHPASWLNARRWEDEQVRTATEYYGRMEA